MQQRFVDLGHASDDRPRQGVASGDVGRGGGDAGILPQLEWLRLHHCSDGESHLISARRGQKPSSRPAEQIQVAWQRRGRLTPEVPLKGVESSAGLERRRCGSSAARTALAGSGNDGLSPRIFPEWGAACVEKLQRERHGRVGKRREREIHVRTGGRIAARSRNRTAAPAHEQRRLRREQVHALSCRLIGELPQRAQVVERPERASFSGCVEVAVPNVESRHRRHRKVRRDGLPARAAVE